MGGFSYRIWGRVSEGVLQAATAVSSEGGAARGPGGLASLNDPLPESFRRYLESLTPRQAIDALAAYSDRGQMEIEEPGAGLAAALQASIAADFSAFLKQGLPQPWPASSTLLDVYFRHNPLACYVRQAEAGGGDQADWFLQLHFSAAGGMHQVSAAVLCHWAALWHEARADAIEGEILGPAGFAPSEQRDAPGLCFVATPHHGYAEFIGAREATREDQGVEGDSSEQPSGQGLDAMTQPHRRLNVPFVLDRAAYQLEDAQAVLLRLLRIVGGQITSDSKCRCQLCAPDFDLAVLEDGSGEDLTPSPAP